MRRGDEMNRIEEELRKLLSVCGVSGTSSEREMGLFLEERVRAIPYFAKHSDCIYRIPVPNDPLNRFCVAALLESDTDSRDCVIITGHYDVVGIEEYGMAAPYATDPDTLEKVLAQEELPAEARSDLQSGTWLFGRGSADMKYGLALCLDQLREFAAEKESGRLKGNLLFLGVCSEETNSEGMRSACSFLVQLQKEKKLDYIAMCLTECHELDEQEPDTHWIQLGSCGKVMPFFYCIGKTTHAREPFEGLDANAINAAVYRRMQLNPDFVEHAHGQSSPPPICLHMEDRRARYSVSMPEKAVSYYNLITLCAEPECILEKLKKIAQAALEEALCEKNEKYQAYRMRIGKTKTGDLPAPQVLTYRTLLRLAREKGIHISNADSQLPSQEKPMAEDVLSDGIHIQEQAIRQVERLIHELSLEGPLVVTGFLPPYYPNVFPQASDPRNQRLLRCVEDICHEAQAEGVRLSTKNYFMGISDLCYSGLGEQDCSLIFQNLVTHTSYYSFPIEALQQLNIPGVNVGGYGKDIHKREERLERSFSFTILPGYFHRLIERLFG